MIKQELNILQEQGYIDMKSKRQVIEAALLDCENSLQESYDIIYNNLHHHQRDQNSVIKRMFDENKANVLENIKISLTILKLMKGSY